MHIKKEFPESKEKSTQSRKRKHSGKFINDKYPNTNQKRIGISGVEESHTSYSCDLCNSSFSRECNLSSHKKKCHSKENTDVRAKKTENPENAIEEKKLPVCTECQRCFKNNKLLNLHHVSVHSITPNSFKCCKCGRIFKKAASLKRHELVHSNLRNFSCSECETYFKHKSSYMKHKATVHSEERLFQCKKCDSSFKLNSVLKMHYQRAHTNVRPHKCDKCKMSFKTRSDWTAHQSKVHLGTRSFKCEKCQKAFKSKGDLKIHQVSHTNVRPHNCEECNSSYKTIKALKVHQKKHNS